MSRAGMLIFLGVLTIITPFSGLPIAIRSLLAVIFGACIFGIGLSFRIHHARRAQISAEVPIPELNNSPSEVPQRDPQRVDSEKILT